MKKLMKGMLLLPVFMVIFLVAMPAQAADLRSDDTIIIASGEVINDDLYLVGNRIIINGTVNGDVVCIGNHITMAGRVDGTITAIGITVEIEGDVTQSVQTAASNVTVSGEIGGDVVAAGDDINLTDQATIGRDLVFAGRSVNVDALINDGIQGTGTKIVLNNVIGSDVEVGVDRLTITSTAVIQGDLVYTSENEATIQNGARIIGTTTHILAEHFEIPHIGLWASFIAFLMTLVTGIVIILIAPKRARAVADAVKMRPLATLGWGALLLFVTPIALAIVFITIIGIPLSIMGAVIYGIAIFLSQVVIGLFIGYWILGHFSNIESRGLLIGAFVLGFTLLTLVRFVPYIGWIIWLATAVFGIGAMAMSQKILRSNAVKSTGDTTVG